MEGRSWTPPWRAPRDEIIRKTGEQARLQTSAVFEQVYLLAQRLGLEYTRALQIVAGKARATSIKSLLLRFASSISSGESEHIFIREETRIEGGRYRAEYARSVENLKKWTDAYAALLVSVSLIVVVTLVSTLLGAMEQGFILIVGFTMLMITSGGVFIILRTAPYEQTTYDGTTGGPPDRAKARFLLRTLGPLGILLALGVGYLFGMGLALLVLSAFLFPIGYYARADDKKVSQIDEEVSQFIRTPGTIAGTTDTTLVSALTHVDLTAMGSLSPYVERLRTRLSGHLSTEDCWERFKAETGSELLGRATEMLVDSVEMGANGEEVGDIASSYASSVRDLRQTRQMAASSFSLLVIPMHTAMTALLLFILQIVFTFDEKLREVSTSVTEGSLSAGGAASISGTGLFQAQDLGFISTIITGVIVVLTVANALAPKFAAGGHHLKIAYTLSVTCGLSGLNMLIVPRIASGLLGG